MLINWSRKRKTPVLAGQILRWNAYRVTAPDIKQPTRLRARTTGRTFINALEDGKTFVIYRYTP